MDTIVPSDQDRSLDGKERKGGKRATNAAAFLPSNTTTLTNKQQENRRRKNIGNGSREAKEPVKLGGKGRPSNKDKLMSGSWEQVHPAEELLH